MYILAIAGFSGAGKDTIANELSKITDWKLVVSDTDRPQKSWEIDGVNYYFRTDKEFQHLVDENEFVEYREYDTNDSDGNPIQYRYGLRKSEFNSIFDGYICVVDIKGTKDLMEEYGDKVYSVFIESDEDTRLERVKSRDAEFNLIEWKRRCEDDATIFNTVEDEVDVIVLNNKSISDVVEVVEYLTKQAFQNKYRLGL